MRGGGGGCPHSPNHQEHISQALHWWCTRLHTAWRLIYLTHIHNVYRVYDIQNYNGSGFLYISAISRLGHPLPEKTPSAMYRKCRLRKFSLLRGISGVTRVAVTVELNTTLSDSHDLVCFGLPLPSLLQGKSILLMINV